MNEAELKQAVETSPPTRTIPYAPVPMSWSISTTSSSEGQVVVVQIATPEGDKVFFLNPSIAKQIGDAIVKQSILAETGLIVPQ